MDASILITLSNDVLSHGERGASKIKGTGADYFENKFSSERILLSKSREREREGGNETDKKCIILRKNELKKVLKQFRKEIIPSKILWYFFFFPFSTI